jgi:hypothetical protein
MRRLHVALAAVLVHLVQASYFSPAAVGAAKPGLPSWNPEKVMLGRLAPATRAAGGRLRPPKGYALQQQREATREHAAWLGPIRTDGTRPSLLLLRMTSPPDEKARYTAVQALDRMLTAVQRRRRRWQQSATERGRVGGLEFARARWSGIEPNTGREMKGFIYVAVAGRQIVQISSQDITPYHAASLRLAEAAALTFQWR